jgi:hypothetical protein
MAGRYSYFNYDGIPCRLSASRDSLGSAQAYRPGEGFIGTPTMAVLNNAKPITKAQFDAMVLGFNKRTEV